MSVNGVTNTMASAYTAGTTTTAPKAEEKADKKTTTAEAGVVYEPSKEAKESKTNKVTDYSSIVSSMKSELSNKNQQLQNLVSQLMGKQANKYKNLSDLFKNINADPATIAQAKKDISDDGYWGVEQTSDRLVSMAKALSGGDSSKADELIAAVKKGFKQATHAWGDELPDICKRTIDTTVKKMEDWRDGITGSTATEAAAAAE